MRRMSIVFLFAVGCGSASTLREAQDSFNTGTRGMSSRPRSLEGDAAPEVALTLPIVHFQTTLKLIEEGKLTADGTHLGYAALLLQAYSHYSIYRLLPPGEEANGHRERALAAPFAAAYERIPAEKKPLVRRENALFLLLGVLIRAEDHMRKYEASMADRPAMDALFKNNKKDLEAAVKLLGGAGPDSVTHVPFGSPVAEYAVMIVCDVAHAAFAALDRTSIPAGSAEQLAAANEVGKPAHAAAAWILGKPAATLAELKLRLPRLHARFVDLRAFADHVCGAPGAVTALPR
jgi:hypothetical protein